MRERQIVTRWAALCFVLSAVYVLEGHTTVTDLLIVGMATLAGALAGMVVAVHDIRRRWGRDVVSEPRSHVITIDREVWDEVLSIHRGAS